MPQAMLALFTLDIQPSHCRCIAEDCMLRDSNLNGKSAQYLQGEHGCCRCRAGACAAL